MKLQARSSDETDRPRAAAVAHAPEKEGKTVVSDTASCDLSGQVAGDPRPSASISFGLTLVMALACGVEAPAARAIAPKWRRLRPCVAGSTKEFERIGTSAMVVMDVSRCSTAG